MMCSVSPCRVLTSLALSGHNALTIPRSYLAHLTSHDCGHDYFKQPASTTRSAPACQGLPDPPHSWYGQYLAEPQVFVDDVATAARVEGGSHSNVDSMDYGAVKRKRQDVDLGTGGARETDAANLAGIVDLQQRSAELAATLNVASSSSNANEGKKGTKAGKPKAKVGRPRTKKQ